MPSSAAANDTARLTSFIRYAENQWHAVCGSASDGPSITFNGDEYRRLPDRFGSREKIEAYFRRCWSKPLSRTLLCNLDPINYQGRRYVIASEPAPAPYTVEGLRILRRSAAGIVVSASLAGGDAGARTIRYTLVSAGGNLTIVSRSGRLNDSRFARCTS
ncbi:hypothetical protein [Cohnella hongkongensis]|uniref:Uncharacterized protein n=1 Tax=Cohnella hongkongensis TaxID=178337 RepID=A0ABV9FCT1_9BACL